jgi:hypothetical protein
MKLSNSDHTSRPFRIHELTGDFRLEDVWALPTPGGPDDFPRLVAMMASGDPEHDSPSRPARALWKLRWKLGEVFGWDETETSLGGREPTLRDRLPADLREGPRGPGSEVLPFTPVYMTDDEFASEVANRTVHGVMHLSWVEDGAGGYRGQMAVYVKPNGLFGNAYMAAIRPFRHLIVYPPMLGQIERQWRNRDRGAEPDVVRQVEVPATARSLARLPQVDYADAFLVDTRRVGRRSGEEWARAMLEEAPAGVQASLWRGWWLLGLKVEPRGAPGTVLGWQLVHSDDDFALLALESRLGMPARLLLKPEGEMLLFGTFIQHRNPLMRAVWSAIAQPHQEIVPRLLAQAERRLADGRRAAV